MTLPLPLASYLFILRKHRWLVLGTAILVLVVGYVYTNQQIPQYKATAKVKIVPKIPLGVAATPFDFADSAHFIADQVHILRTEERLGWRALELLRGPAATAADVPAPTGTSPIPAATDAHPQDVPEAVADDATDASGAPMPEVKDSSRFAGMSGKRILGMIVVQGVPGTSYWEVSAIGPDQDGIYAIANAYARVFERVFREERARQTRAQQKAYSSKRDVFRARRDDVRKELEAFKKANPTVDFDKGTNPDKDYAESIKRMVSQDRASLVLLESELRRVAHVLESVKLELVPGAADSAHTLAPPLGDDAARDPRLSARVQSLPVVDRHAAIPALRQRIASLLEEDYRRELLSVQPEHSDRVRIMDRVRVARRELAEQTEAALLRLADDVVQARRAVADLEIQAQELERKANGNAIAMAECERIQKRALDLENDIARVEAILAEGDKKRLDEAGDTVSLHEWARPGLAVLVRPNKVVMYLMTVLAALTLAGGLAYILEYLDDTVKTREDFDRLVRLPFLGYVPHIHEAEDGDRDRVVAQRRTGSPEVEAFRAIRTGVQFARSDKEVRTLLISSAGPHEGKTTVCANLAASFATGATRTLLVDADLRRARAHRALGVDNSVGLTNVLVGGMSLESAIQKSSVPGLDVLASGPIPPNPAEILGSGKMKELLVEAAKLYEYVIVDSPPVVAVTDPALLAKHVDAVFLVISVGKTSVRLVNRAREAFAAVGSVIHGAVLNNADEQASIYYYGYYKGRGYTYGYGYAAPEGAPRIEPVGGGDSGPATVSK
jgi:capsular exopolysaccharide synthesis family protein